MKQRMPEIIDWCRRQPKGDWRVYEQAKRLLGQMEPRVYDRALQKIIEILEL